MWTSKDNTKFTSDESALIEHIQNRLNALAPRAANSSEDDAYRIREMCNNYLPETIRKYLEIDTDQRDDVNSSGMTNRETFIEQIHKMESALAIYAGRLSNENQSLVTNGAFLANILPPEEQLVETHSRLAERMKEPTNLSSPIIDQKRMRPGDIFIREGQKIAELANVEFLKSPSGQGYRGTTGTDEDHIIAVVPRTSGDRPLTEFEKHPPKILTRAIACSMVVFGDIAVARLAHYNWSAYWFTCMITVSLAAWFLSFCISSVLCESKTEQNVEACNLAWKVATCQNGTRTGDPRSDEQAMLMALPYYHKAVDEYDKMLAADIASSIVQAQRRIPNNLASGVF